LKEGPKNVKGRRVAAFHASDTGADFSERCCGTLLVAIN
jgi:hypothetical protein